MHYRINYFRLLLYIPCCITAESIKELKFYLEHGKDNTKAITHQVYMIDLLYIKEVTEGSRKILFSTSSSHVTLPIFCTRVTNNNDYPYVG